MKHGWTMTEEEHLRVLVVDDDADTRVNLADILDLDGWRVSTAGTAAEALDRADWGEYAAVILDRRLPDGTSDELLPKIRRLAPRAEVVIVTGHADVAGAVAAMRLGAVDFILKPVDAGELRTRLGRIAEKGRACRALRERETILRLVLDTISDGVLVVDGGGRRLLSNPALERIIGPLPPGRGPADWAEFIAVYNPGATEPCPPDELALSRALRGETVEDVEHVVRRPGCGDRWVSASAAPLREPAGAIRGAVVVLRDITERKRAEEQVKADERLLQSVLDNAPGRIAIKDSEGRLLLVNRRFAELAGRSIWDVVGRTDRCLFSGPGPEQVQANDRIALAGGRLMQFEEVLDLPGGPRTFLSVKVPAVGVGFPGQVLFEFTTDITERKRAEERAVRAERLAAIGQMVAGLAHESGNALQRSQACLQILARRARGRADLLDLVDRVQAAQDHLLHLYDNVRSFAATIRLEPERGDLAGLWRTAWENLEVQRKGRDTRLRERLPFDTSCRVDHFRMQQVFRNLLENALAACPDPVVIDVKVKAIEHHGRPAFRVHLRDNGPGLTADERDRMFEPFYTTKTKGTGLGLALARRIVEAHEGRIEPGDEGPGCEIVITIPQEVA
jgi:PAS domain S-box-containing protein